MDECSRPGPALLAIIDELLIDVASVPSTTATAPKSPDPPIASKPAAKKITPRQFERTVYARMKGSERKTKESYRQSQLRAEEKLLREASGRPVISQDAKELKRPPLYSRSIELEKELRTKREKIHQEKLMEEREIEEKIVEQMREREKKAKAACRRDPKEFFEYNRVEVERREKQLAALRAEKAAKELAGLNFHPNISQKSRILAQKKGSFEQRLALNAQVKQAKLASLCAKYTPSFQPALPSHPTLNAEVFTRLYTPRRRSESPKRRRSLADPDSPPHTDRTTLIITEDSDEDG